MLGSLGGQVARVLVVACEPESVDEGIGLSAVVQAAVPDAVAVVEQVITGVHESVEGRCRNDDGIDQVGDPRRSDREPWS